MRKRISCKVIRSVTLDKSDNIALCANAEYKFSDIAALSYTNRLQITKIEDFSTSQILDCHA